MSSCAAKRRRGETPKRSSLRCAGPLLLALLLSGTLAAEQAGGSADCPPKKDKGQLSVGLRYRFESVSEDALAKDGNASTLRTTLAYRSPSLYKLSAFVEFEDVTDLGLDDQHDNAGAGSLSNGVSDRPVIADPDLTEVHQAYVRYAGLRGTTLDVGRQQIALGNERFVGPVGWRQNFQSFDAVRLTQTSLPRTTLQYVYVDNVNRVFGDDKRMQSHLLDVAVEFEAIGRLTPYFYLLDYDVAADAVLSARTWGARWEGRVELDERWSLPYHVEAARQDDAGDNPGRVDAGYWRLELGGERVAAGRLSLRVGVELLEGSPADGRFGTPLATLHKFNGWADKFLVTPANGVEDRYVVVGGKPGRLHWSVALHDFRSDSAGLDYGREVDAEVAWDAPWKQRFALTLAAYRSDGFSTDTDKIWFWTRYAF